MLYALTALLLAIPALQNPEASQPDTVVVEMKPCDLRRPKPMMMLTSNRLVRKGEVRVGDQTYSIYLPRAREYRLVGKRVGAIPSDATAVSVDQDRDGKISATETFLADCPLRIADSVFDIVSIAKDGSKIELRRRKGPLVGCVSGRIAPAFDFETTSGKRVKRDDFRGRYLVIHFWAPT